MWSALTDTLPKNTAKLLALCMLPAFYQAIEAAVGNVAVYVNPKHMDTSRMIKRVEEESPEITYINVPDVVLETSVKKNIDKFINELISKRHTVVVADDHHSERWNHLALDERRCKGDLAFFSNNRTILEQLYEWSCEDEDNGIPKCVEHTEDPSFGDLLKGIAEDSRIDGLCSAAFAGSLEEEDEPKEAKVPIDGIQGDDDIGPGSMDNADERDLEADMLEQLPLPGYPQKEQERRKKWLEIPRRTRIAIRRLHRNLRHLPKQALLDIMRAGRCPEEYIEAAKYFRCETCDVEKKKVRRHTATPPKPYEFNHDIGVDVIDTKDAAGTHYSILNCVDNGTTLQQGYIVRASEVHGVPSSNNCLKAFVKGWVRWAGWPKHISCDRGLHNRGTFGTTVASKGVRVRPAALESPEHIGRTERRGDLLKRIIKKIVTDTKAVGQEAMEMILSEALNAINEMSRHGGFAPVQWVLSKQPRTPGTQGDENEAYDIGTIQAHVNAPEAFAMQSRYRFIARKSFIKWDCGERMQRALLRNAGPVPGPYRLGDIVSYCREARKGETGIQWSIGSRIIGFETSPDKPGSDPSSCWVICDGVPVCVALDKIRPCTAPELLAYQYMASQNPRSVEIDLDGARQQSFLDERHPMAENMPETVGGIPVAEWQPVAIYPPESSSEEEVTAEELRASPKELRAAPEKRTQEEQDEDAPNPLARELKRSKTTGKGVDLVQNIANLLVVEDDSKHDRERIAFLNDRQYHLVGGRPKNRSKKPVRAKDGDKNLRYSQCDPHIQKGLRKARAEEWKKWQKFNAGVILSKPEVDQLTNEGVTIQPMQWVETDKNAHKRRDDNSVTPELKSRLVGCGNFEETQGLRTDSPTADVDAHNLIFSFCASNHILVKSADIQAAYLQGKPVDRIILYKIPRGGIPECGIAEDTVIAARVPIYGTKDAGRGFWLRLSDDMRREGFKLNRILPTLFAFRDSDENIVGMMTSNVDDLLFGVTGPAEKAMMKVLEGFNVREAQEGQFRFCGKEIVQYDDYSIRVSAKDNTEKIRPIKIPEKRKLTSECTPTEVTQVRSVTAALAWVGRQTRPDLSYRVSRMQTLIKQATIREMKECNKILEYALSTSGQGIYFSSSGFTWDDMVISSIGDASFGNDKVLVKDEYEDGRSQQGYIIALSAPSILNDKETIIHPITWSSTTITRACRSTLMAETFAMTKGTEAGARIRAAIVDAKGQLDIRNWEESAADALGHVWFTDCDSLYEHLVSTRMNQIENKRLRIDMSALRQQIWERGGERTETIDFLTGDYPRWIDTSAMIADPLTKVMNAERMIKTFETGVFDMTPTEESLRIKERNRECRSALRKKTKDKRGALPAEEEEEPDS
jgi:hypothetical protein